MTEAGPVDRLAHHLEPLQAGLEPLVVQLVLLVLLRAEGYKLDIPNKLKYEKTTDHQEPKNFHKSEALQTSHHHPPAFSPI